MAESGAGAWKNRDGTERFYRLTDPYMGSERDTYDEQRTYHGVLAFKKELNRYGFPVRNMNNGIFGRGMHDAVVAYQKKKKLSADGIIGPKTARSLFSALLIWSEFTAGLPGHILCAKAQLEGAWDPAAEGRLDRDDRGLFQINEFYHGYVTDEQAWDPVFSIGWTVNRLLNFVRDFGPNWDAAIAYHNHQAGAIELARTGTIKNDDTRERVLNYIRVVRNAEKSFIDWLATQN